MSTTELRQMVKRVADSLPPKKLASLADFAGYLNGKPERLSAEDKKKIAAMRRSVARAEREYAQGKTVNWRSVRRDV